MAKPDSPEPSDQLDKTKRRRWPLAGRKFRGPKLPKFVARHQRIWIGIGTFFGVLAAALLFVLINEPHNVSNPNVAFTPTIVSKPPPAPNFIWPDYGYTAARTRDFTGDADLHPPFRRAWVRGGNALLEFPPVIDGPRLFFMDDGATVKAVSVATGEIIWHTNIGTLSAASPAINTKTGLIYVPVLSVAGSSPGGGEFVALHMSNGHVAWKIPVAAGSESSPVIDGNVVYFGDQAGNVYARNAATGARIWKFIAGGAVKGGPAIADNLLYVGDYSGQLYALRLATGHVAWSTTTSGGTFGFGSGNFYSTPTVAFGRVFIGNTDGFVYSFAAKTGQLAWSTGTGAYVYSSAAATNTPGLGPTVYIGSYDGYLYAFNARSGSIRWRHYDGARISGSPTVVNNVVYYSDLGRRTTTGLNARTGKVVFRLQDGAFTPVVADQNAIFLCGYNALYRFDPLTPKHHQVASKKRTKRAHK